ncbi:MULTISPECIES: daptide-type RiPP [Microbacterium]|jgi:hypothetical protein|uniref:Uncharacterized protein n=1 Tax=Microbacterium mcarthurae TaxID=3035918 RepID=A0ABW9GGV6_9MICO|nr:daptide-type RiPP [Microbacterium sp. ACRRU]MCG7416910.1 hypothetical protein [Microbacterium sp. ACRRU]
MTQNSPVLELAMQELEPMEAPGWWTAAGVAAGVIASASAAYGSYVLTAAAYASAIT